MQRNTSFSISVLLALAVLIFMGSTILSYKKEIKDLRQDKLILTEKFQNQIDSIGKVNGNLVVERDSLQKVKNKIVEKIIYNTKEIENEKEYVQSLNDSLSIIYFNDYLSSYRTRK